MYCPPEIKSEVKELLWHPKVKLSDGARRRLALADAILTNIEKRVANKNNEVNP